MDILLPVLGAQDEQQKHEQQANAGIVCAPQVGLAASAMAQSMPDRPVLSPVAPDLRERFSALFANLAREEDALKNVLSQNELMEKQLQAVRRSRSLA